MITAMNTDERRGCTSASNAESDTLCPARHLMQRGMPHRTSVWAETGDRIHRALATGKRDGLSFDENQRVDECLEIEKRKLIEFFGEADAAKARAFRENPDNPEGSRLWVRFRDGSGRELEHSCRPDVFYRLLNKAIIFEYKTLAGDIPDSPRNLQLRDQQCIIRGNFVIAGDIGVCVIQPMVTRDPVICVYTPEDSKAAEAQMFQRVANSNDPKSVPTANEVSCKFCLARPKCKAYQQWAGAMVPAMLNVMEVPVADWSPEQRAMAANVLKPCKDLIAMVEESIRDALSKDPNGCPGWTLKPGARVETINNPQVAFNRFTQLGGSLEQFMDAVKVSKTALKEHISAITSTRGKALEKHMKELTDGIVDVRQNAPSLKRSEDDAPALEA